MSYFDGLTPIYTFRLQIERSDRTILDAAITAKAAPDELAKTKRSIQRLLNEYAPAAVIPAPTQPPEQPTALLPPAADQPEQPAEAALPQSTSGAESTPRPDRKLPVGGKGLLRLRCKECGNIFVIFLWNYQTEIVCRCGHHIDLTAPLAKYHYTCPYCEKDGWGQTNLEDPEITVKCKCGGDIDLRWNPKAREYQN